MKVCDYDRILVDVEVSYGLLKSTLKRGYWSGTPVVGRLEGGRAGGWTVKRLWEEKEGVKKKKGKKEESLEQ